MLDHQDNNGQTPVLAAICKCTIKPVYTECIEVLLAAGADVHTSTHRQQTALHMAARHGLLEVCQCLLKYGASLEQFDSWGLAPIHDAAAKGKTNVVESMIVEYGMSVDHLDSDNNTVNSVARLFPHVTHSYYPTSYYPLTHLVQLTLIVHKKFPFSFCILSIMLLNFTWSCLSFPCS